MVTKIWAIGDNRCGHLHQLQAVVDNLKKLFEAEVNYSSNKNFKSSALKTTSADVFECEIFKFKNTFLGKFAIDCRPMGVKKNALLPIYQSLKNKPPNVIIVIGRRNLSLALFLKRLVKQYNPSVKLIFLMPPAKVIPAAIDLVFHINYSPTKRYNPENPLFVSQKLAKTAEGRIHFTNFPAVNFNDSISSKIPSSKDDILQDLKKHCVVISNTHNVCNNVSISSHSTIIGLVIGGKGQHNCWNEKVIKELCAEVSLLQEQTGGTIIATTSRRTGAKYDKLIQNKLPSGSLFWSFFKNYNAKYNPYYYILRASDIIVVTGDSVSMITESIDKDLNPNAKTLIFDSKSFELKRYQIFLDFIYKHKYAQPLSSALKNGIATEFTKNHNTVIEIAKAIKKLINP